MNQRSLGALVIGVGLIGLEKMVVGDSQQGNLGHYVNIAGKVSILAGIVGYGIGILESIRTGH